MKISQLVWSIFIGLIGFSALTRWQGLSEEPLIMTDGQGYYAYLPAVFIYQDLQFHFVDSINQRYYPEDKRANYIVPSEQGNVNKYFVGTAVVQTPFFLLGSGLSWVFGLPVDGYSWPFQLMVGIAAISSVCFGLYLLGKLLLGLGFQNTVTGFALVLILFATNLLYYTIYEPSMSHAYTFLTVSGFLYYAWKSHQETKLKYMLIAAICYGLTIVIRPTNALIILALPFLTEGLFGTVQLFERSFGKPKLLLLCAAVIVAVVLIQPIIYLIQTGSPVVWSYSNEGFNFFDPELNRVLFSYRKGLFVYCPALLLSVLGVVIGIWRGKAGFGWLAFTLMLSTWVIASWWMWYYGGSYGHRAFIDLYPLFAIGFAVLLKHGIGFLGTKQTMVLAALLIPFQLVQTYQYTQHIIPFDNMNKEKFWNLFLRTGSDLAWYYPGYEGEGGYVGLDSLVVTHNMEQNLGWGNENQITTEQGIDNTSSAKMAHDDSYGITLRRSVSELPASLNVIRVTGMVRSDSWTTDLSIVCSIEDSLGNGYYWKKHPIRPQFEGLNEWSLVTAVFNCGQPRSSTDQVIIYPMKSDGATVHFDELEISFVRAK